jgi:hypothetical protein
MEKFPRFRHGLVFGESVAIAPDGPSVKGIV